MVYGHKKAKRDLKGVKASKRTSNQKKRAKKAIKKTNLKELRLIRKEKKTLKSGLVDSKMDDAGNDSTMNGTPARGLSMKLSGTHKKVTILNTMKRELTQKQRLAMS
jgi:hypothetical protein